MRRVVAFSNISVDGFFSDTNGDLSWAQAYDPEFDSFFAETVRCGGTLVLGRVTYELLANYWPTAFARRHNPTVAERMNAAPKLVFSRTLPSAAWENSIISRQNPAATLREMKLGLGGCLTILGSGSLVAALAREKLIDELHFVVNPVVLGRGRTMFGGIREGLSLTPTRTRAFENGNVLLCYAVS
jgi:dihydrofolate reductase